MSTENGSPHATEGRRTRRDVDPLQMTEADKRMAEWEARHDVAARGHRGAPDVLQHYFAHERVAHPPRPRPAAVHHPAAGSPVPDARQATPVVADPPQRPRGLLRRLLHRAP
ncbi:hypothetical protein [Blastococcus montanus]|uniref:hypothetical protein n=1 Tax=Blastococcus montanus TaxID=3144973 RepID=UPI0032087891